MWEELGVTGMLSHIGWAFSTGDEAARQSSPTASCDTADVPSLVRSSGAGLAPGAGPRHLWAAPQPPGPALPLADCPAPPQRDPEGRKALTDLFWGGEAAPQGLRARALQELHPAVKVTCSEPAGLRRCLSH